METINGSLPAASLDRLFLSARTTYRWQDRPVDDAQLRDLYDLLRYGPTSANSNPGRFVFVRSEAAKARLIECVSPGNVKKVRGAPVTAIVAADLAFHSNLPKLFPHNPAMQKNFLDKPSFADETARRNATLQGAYLILAARALGLDCGPMSGFDREAVDRAFLSGTTWRSDFICNIGHGDATDQPPRLPRLGFDEACLVI